MAEEDLEDKVDRGDDLGGEAQYEAGTGTGLDGWGADMYGLRGTLKASGTGGDGGDEGNGGPEGDDMLIGRFVDIERGN
jgi:hypothetical protein